MYASVALPRFRSILMGVFAFIALLLAAIGIYGVMTYSVLQRTQELAIRLALGATRWNVVGRGGRHTACFLPCAGSQSVRSERWASYALFDPCCLMCLQAILRSFPVSLFFFSQSPSPQVIFPQFARHAKILSGHCAVNELTSVPDNWTTGSLKDSAGFHFALRWPQKVDPGLCLTPNRRVSERALLTDPADCGRITSKPEIIVCWSGRADLNCRPLAPQADCTLRLTRIAESTG